MQLSSPKKNLLALALIAVLGLGGYYRWNRLPVEVRVLSGDSGTGVACSIPRSELKAIPHSTMGGWVDAEIPVAEWPHDTPLEKTSIWGSSMGTTFSIQVADVLHPPELDRFIKKIEATLEGINRQMSTWDKESEISRFNHSGSTEPFAVSPGFATVVGRALEFSRSTEGAFDPTLQPLLNLWGFGSEGEERRIPSDSEIAEARKQTGWRKISVASPARLRKSEPGVSLALGAIAKGYGVDSIAAVLKEGGCENWFVEIGGEVVVKGANPDGVPWKIGIQYPATNPMEERLQGIVHLSEGAIATSGDYRNYIRKKGVVYSHILDPRSGRTVLSDTASVTVFASNCMDADAAATALFVMGPTAGMAWVERRTDIEAMFLLREGGGEIREQFSSGFAKATRYGLGH